MSMSNIEYYALKKRAGLHNWGFMNARHEFDFDLDELEDMDIEDVLEPEILHQNAFGEFYAVQDYEE